ncbi:MAG TPA: hypothetical protein VIQ30_08300 [Pseudonocardia sp.]
MIVEPAVGVERQLTNVDTHMDEVQGDHPAPFIQVHMAAAQVSATCALVHAVREMTSEIRKLREGAGS